MFSFFDNKCLSEHYYRLYPLSVAVRHIIDIQTTSTRYIYIAKNGPKYQFSASAIESNAFWSFIIVLAG